MRFARAETHEAMFELLREELCSPERIERKRARGERIVREQEEENREPASTDAVEC